MNDYDDLTTGMRYASTERVRLSRDAELNELRENLKIHQQELETVAWEKDRLQAILDRANREKVYHRQLRFFLLTAAGLFLVLLVVVALVYAVCLQLPISDFSRGAIFGIAVYMALDEFANFMSNKRPVRMSRPLR